MSRPRLPLAPPRADGEGYHEMVVMVKVRRYGRPEGLDAMVETIRRELELRIGEAVVEVRRHK